MCKKVGLHKSNKKVKHGSKKEVAYRYVESQRSTQLNRGMKNVGDIVSEFVVSLIKTSQVLLRRQIKHVDPGQARPLKQSKSVKTESSR